MAVSDKQYEAMKAAMKGGKRKSAYSKIGGGSSNGKKEYYGSGSGFSQLLNKQKVAIQRQTEGQTTDSNN